MPMRIVSNKVSSWKVFDGTAGFGFAQRCPKFGSLKPPVVASMVPPLGVNQLGTVLGWITWEP